MKLSIAYCHLGSSRSEIKLDDLLMSSHEIGCISKAPKERYTIAFAV